MDLGSISPFLQFKSLFTFRFSKIGNFVHNLAVMARNIIGAVYAHLDQNF